VNEEEAGGPQLHEPSAVERGNLEVGLERAEECEFLQNLVTSMPTRMQEVVDIEGGMTRY
jgi:hypothetical protein